MRASTVVRPEFQGRAAVENYLNPTLEPGLCAGEAVWFNREFTYAALFDSRGVARRGAGRLALGNARGRARGPGIRGSRTVAPPAGIRPRRPHEDRARYRAYSLRRAPGKNDRLAHRRAAGEP